MSLVFNVAWHLLAKFTFHDCNSKLHFAFDLLLETVSAGTDSTIYMFSFTGNKWIERHKKQPISMQHLNKKIVSTNQIVDLAHPIRSCNTFDQSQCRKKIAQ